MADGYAGDVSPRDAWDWLEDDADTVLVDCRTAAEWNYVGLPDLARLGKETVTVEWVDFPANERNPSFVNQVRAAGIGPGQRVLFLCRSGVRSIGAAKALTEAGYGRAYNVLEGFEGDKDDAGHRATVGGWKVAGLPWRQ